MTRAILIVDHGSRRAAANAMLERVAELVRQRSPDVHVEVAHMELAEPTIAQGVVACVAAGADEVIVHPYLLGPGRHCTEDIPRLVAEAASAHQGVRFAVTEPLGVHDLIADVIVERVREVTEG